MRVDILVGGRFHAFYLARELLKRGYLGKLITSYPRFEVKKYGLPEEKVESIIIKEILQRSWEKFSGFLRRFYNPQFLIHEIFDKSALKKIEKSDIFVGFSSFSLHSLKKAKKLGVITVLERGSPHILFQYRLAKQEYNSLGLSFTRTHPKIIEKELKEYEEADYICVPSSFARETFLQEGIKEKKLICVPYGVNLLEFKKIPKKDNIFRIIYTGGIRIEKGVHYLLRAFSELKLSNSELLLIGAVDKEMKPFLKKYKGAYKLLGRRPQKELYQYYSQSSVFVMPSLQEGLAMVQLQAMACGLPLISTVNSGAKDLITEGREGFLIPIRSVDSLKEKIMFFYQNPEICEKMGEFAREKAKNYFRWSDYGEKIIKEYKRILNEKIY